ncbi:MAG: outer membrane beta-barrel protein [Owenweeksia sp.]
MSWIDKKYKEEFGEQNFPENLKQKGWAGMEKMLDSQMPVSGGGRAGQLWKSIMVFIIALILLVPAVWYFGFYESSDIPSEPISNDEAITAPQTEENAAYTTGTETPSGALDAVDEASSGGVMDQEVLAGDNRQENKTAESTGSSLKSNVPVVSGRKAGNQHDPVASGNADNNTRITREPANEGKPSGEGTFAQNDLSTTISPREQGVDDLSVASDEEAVEDPVTDPETQATSEPVVMTNETPGNEQPDEKGSSEENTVQAQEASTTAVAEESEKVSLKMTHLAFPDVIGEKFISPQEDEKIDFFSRERFSVSLWGGYAYTGKLLEANNPEYLSKRSAEENPVWSIPTGVNLDYFLNSNWTFGLGIRWAEYGEDVQYDLSRRDTAIVDGRYSSVNEFPNIVSVDSMRVIDGMFQGHWEYTVVYDSRDTTAESYNGRTTWRYIEVPVTIGYRFGSGRLKPWIRGGVSFGVPVQTSFRYINPQAIYELQNKQQEAPLQYNGILNLGVDYYLARNFSLRLNGFGLIQLNPSLIQQGVRQRYYQVGVSLGAAYNF